MIVDEEVYFKHFGVKGMHWGVRNDRKRVLTPQEKQRRTFKRVQRVGRATAAVGTVGLVALTVHSLIQQNRAVKLRKIQAAAKRADYLNQMDMWKKARKVKFSQVHSTFEVNRKGVASRIGSLPRTSPIDFRVGPGGLTEVLR